MARKGMGYFASQAAGFDTPFRRQAEHFVRNHSSRIDQKLSSGRRYGEQYSRVRYEFQGLSPNTQRIIGLTAAGVAASTVTGVLRVAVFKNANVRPYQAYKRQRTNARIIKRTVGGRPGIRVRYTGIRAGSIRSRSDRIYA